VINTLINWEKLKK